MVSPTYNESDPTLPQNPQTGHLTDVQRPQLPASINRRETQFRGFDRLKPSDDCRLAVRGFRAPALQSVAAHALYCLRHHDPPKVFPITVDSPRAPVNPTP